MSALPRTEKPNGSPALAPHLLAAKPSEAGSPRKTKKFPVRRSFRRKAETER